jgi:hypothetical protein
MYDVLILTRIFIYFSKAVSAKSIAINDTKSERQLTDQWRRVRALNSNGAKRRATDQCGTQN